MFIPAGVRCIVVEVKASSGYSLSSVSLSETIGIDVIDASPKRFTRILYAKSSLLGRLCTHREKPGSLYLVFTMINSDAPCCCGCSVLRGNESWDKYRYLWDNGTFWRRGHQENYMSLLNNLTSLAKLSKLPKLSKIKHLAHLCHVSWQAH